MPLRIYQPEEAEDIRERLRALEIPDCDCKQPLLPCLHRSRIECGKDGKDVLVPERRVLDHDGRVIPCDCPEFRPPCEHVFDADHAYPLDQWAARLSLTWPEEYDDRPEPLFAGMALSREDRVEIYAEREEDGFALWHPGDLWRASAADDSLRAGVEIDQGKNGALNDGQIRRAA